jgi:predicted DCC family thiol-disulfide oxidoreductase YuxK
VFQDSVTGDLAVIASMQTQTLTIFYDGDCPVCAQYIRLYRLKDSNISFTLSDLRDKPEKVAEFAALGFDVDEGMIVELDEKLYHGVAAVHVLALLSTPVGVFNRCNRWIFSRPGLAKIVYPVLVSCRKVLLALLGRGKIQSRSS